MLMGLNNSDNAFQTLAATLIVSGPQTVHIDTHGTGGAGSHIVITTPNVMITVHDRKAAKTYAQAWVWSGEWALQLPIRRDADVEVLSPGQPGIAIRAYGQDKVRSIFDPHRRELVLRIGYLTWIVADRESHASLTDAWRSVLRMAPMVLPKFDQAPRHRPA